MRRTLPRWMRRLHQWGAVLAVLPLLVVIVSGVLLLRNESTGSEV